MLTRVRFETFTVDMNDAQRELDELELALLVQEGKGVQLLPDDSVEPLAEDPADAIAELLARFNRAFGRDAFERKVTHQVMALSPDGDGWVCRRVVRYDGGAYTEAYKLPDLG